MAAADCTNEVQGALQQQEIRAAFLPYHPAEDQAIHNPSLPTPELEEAKASVEGAAELDTANNTSETPSQGTSAAVTPRYTNRPCLHMIHSFKLIYIAFRMHSYFKALSCLITSSLQLLPLSSCTCCCFNMAHRMCRARKLTHFPLQVHSFM